MKSIPVNRGENTYEAQVDDDDYDFLVQFRWRASPRKTVIYANATVFTEAEVKSVEMHRMVIGDAPENWDLYEGVLRHKLPNGKIVYFVPAPYRYLRKVTVDHIDGNGLNNTRANLRHLSCSEQNRNRKHF